MRPWIPHLLHSRQAPDQYGLQIWAAASHVIQHPYVDCYILHILCDLGPSGVLACTIRGADAYSTASRHTCTMDAWRSITLGRSWSALMQGAQPQETVTAATSCWQQHMLSIPSKLA